MRSTPRQKPLYCLFSLLQKLNSTNQSYLGNVLALIFVAFISKEWECHWKMTRKKNPTPDSPPQLLGQIWSPLMAVHWSTEISKTQSPLSDFSVSISLVSLQCWWGVGFFDLGVEVCLLWSMLAWFDSLQLFLLVMPPQLCLNTDYWFLESLKIQA